MSTVARVRLFLSSCEVLSRSISVLKSIASSCSGRGTWVLHKRFEKSIHQARISASCTSKCLHRVGCQPCATPCSITEFKPVIRFLDRLQIDSLGQHTPREFMILWDRLSTDHHNDGGSTIQSRQKLAFQPCLCVFRRLSIGVEDQGQWRFEALQI